MGAVLGTGYSVPSKTDPNLYPCRADTLKAEAGNKRNHDTEGEKVIKGEK